MSFYERAVEAQEEENAYQQGRSARKGGASAWSNPYDTTDPLFFCWREGWLDEDMAVLARKYNPQEETTP